MTALPPRRLRLLQLVHGYPPAVGGVEFSTRDLCERLVADHDVDVTVFTTNAFTTANFVDGSLPTIPIVANEEQNGVKIERFPVETRWAPVLKQAQRVAWHLRLPGNDRLRTWYGGPIAPQMLRAVREFDADVICAASFPLNHLTYPFRIKEPRPPVVLVGAVHTTNSWGYERPNLIRLIAKSWATISHTEHERAWLIQQGAPADRLHVIGHGIKLEEFRPRPGSYRSAQQIPDTAFVVAYVGQQGGHKGIDTLIQVLPRFLERRPDAWLVVAGSRTPYSAKLRELATALPDPARERVRILDDVSAAVRAELLADCDVFASPSSEESFGITMLEAWSQAKPVIVGDGPAQRSIVEEGVTALLVPHGHPARLLDALSAVAADPELARRLGQQGQRVLHDRYGLTQVVARYQELFADAARSRR